MRNVLLGAAILGALTSGAAAQSAPPADLDPLHGDVCSAGGTSCVNTDNGAFAPIPGPGANWGFTISPGPATGNLTLAILVPTDQITGTFSLPGLTDTNEVTSATITVATPLFGSDYVSTSADLPVFLGLGTGYSPTDNFSNASAGETPAINPGWASSSQMFQVYTVTLNGITLDGQGSGVTLPQITNDFNFGPGLPAGTVVVGMFAETSGPHVGDLIDTAASGDLVVTDAVPGPTAGAGIPGILAGLGLLGFVEHRRRRNRLA